MQRVDFINQLLLERLELSTVAEMLIEQDPRNEFEFGEENKKYFQIAYMLQNLPGYPEMGVDYLMKTISAPGIRCRALTIKTLKAWIEKAGKPLESCYPALYDRLAEAYTTEICEDLKADIQTILDGKTSFPEEHTNEEDEDNDA